MNNATRGEGVCFIEPWWKNWVTMSARVKIRRSFGQDLKPSSASSLFVQSETDASSKKYSNFHPTCSLAKILIAVGNNAGVN